MALQFQWFILQCAVFSQIFVFSPKTVPKKSCDLMPRKTCQVGENHVLKNPAQDVRKLYRPWLSMLLLMEVICIWNQFREIGNLISKVSHMPNKRQVPGSIPDHIGLIIRGSLLVILQLY
jgi:hypothetical protein